MANGQEMMMKQLLKYMGINPEELVGELKRWQDKIRLLLEEQNGKLSRIDAKLDVLHEDSIRIESKLDALIKERGIEWTENRPIPQLKQ